MFMGVGNLICMPLALAVGRRPVFLASCLILILGGVLAAYSKNYEMHLGTRMLLGIGAGNSEALVPMMCVTLTWLRMYSYADKPYVGSRKFTSSTSEAPSSCGKLQCKPS